MQRSFFAPIPNPDKGREIIKAKAAALRERLGEAEPAPLPSPLMQGQFLKVKIEDAPEFEKRTGFVLEAVEMHPLHGPVFRGHFMRREA